VVLLRVSTFLSLLIGYSASQSPPRLLVFTSIILNALIVRNSKLSSTRGTLVDQIGPMNTGYFFRRKILIGGLLRARKKISFANIVKLPPLSGANAIPIHRRKLLPRVPGNLEAPRLSVFKRLGTSSRVRGSQNSVIAKSSGIPMNDPPHRFSSSVSFPRHNGSLIRRGRQGRDDRPFSNANAGLPRTRKLHWRPILRNGPFMSGPGLSASSTSVKAGSSGAVKLRGIWNCFAILRKRYLDFPFLHSLPLKAIAFWKGRHISWITAPSSALPRGL
jgi:hypothetical protein